MTTHSIQSAVNGVIRYYAGNPEKAVSQDVAATAEQLEAIVHWAEKHSPVGDAIGRATPLHLTIDIQD